VKCKTQLAQERGKWQAFEKTDGIFGYHRSTFLGKMK